MWVKKQKLWVWLAYDRDRQQVLGWQVGDRDNHTGRRLLEQIEKVDCCYYASDHWKSYNKFLPYTGSTSNPKQKRIT